MTNAAVYLTDGKEVMLDRLVNVTPTRSAPSIIHMGGMDQSPNAADADLNVKLPKTSTTIDACDATTGWTQSGDGRAVTLNTTAGERKEGTGSLNLPITFSSGTANWSKTISSTNLSNKFLMFYLYISTTAYTNLTSATDTLKITLGTGGYTNINVYDKAKTALQSGWNLIQIDLSTPTSTGGSGATMSTVDSIKIGIKSTASSLTNNIRMDWIHYCSSTDFDISLSSGYPSINYSTLEVTYRGVIGANEMNNYDITNMMLKNSDSTKIGVGEAQFTTISKTNKIIAAVQPKIKIN